MNRSLLTAGLAAFATAVSLALVGASPSRPRRTTSC